MQLDLIKVTASPPPLSAIVRFLFLYLKTEIIIWILKLFPTALHSRSTQWTYVYNKRSVFVFSLLFRRRGESIATAARVYRLLTMIFPFKSDTHTYTYNNYTNFSFIFFFCARAYMYIYTIKFSALLPLSCPLNTRALDVCKNPSLLPVCVQLTPKPFAYQKEENKKNEREMKRYPISPLFYKSFKICLGETEMCMWISWKKRSDEVTGGEICQCSSPSKSSSIFLLYNKK